MYPKGQAYGDAAKAAAEASAASSKLKADEYAKAADAEIIRNYAETKFYQARYGDRLGTITLDFNPDWVPGTGGSLYIRETGVFIAFYVTGVTHRIDLSPPNNGSATTIINFSCGRIGSDPVGVDKDMFLGYDRDKEEKLQNRYLGDFGVITI